AGSFKWNFGDGTIIEDIGPFVEHTYSQAGTYTVTLTIYDAAGHTATDIATVTVHPALTTITTNPSSPDGENGWYKTAPTITLTSDATATTYYKWDAGAETTYTVPFVAPEGEHTLSFYSVDATGNTEPTRTRQFKVDTIAPTTPALNTVDTITASNVASVTVSGTADSTTTVYITASDGVHEVTATTTSSGTFSATLNLTSLADGTITVTAYAEDAAGNTSPVSLAVQAVKDTGTGNTSLVSVSSSGEQSNSRSIVPNTSASISADGRYIAFESDATNLVDGDNNAAYEYDIFVHDRINHTTERVSVASDGTAANDSCYSPSISADGRYVTFTSDASNLVAGDTNNYISDIFVHDRINHTTERVSVASDGTAADGNCWNSSISADGQYIAFDSAATNLVSRDRNRQTDIFVHDRINHTTERVSVASDGSEAVKGSSNTPSISADGQYIAFESSAANLVDGDTNGYADIFVHDRINHTTERVSLSSNGTEANHWSEYASINADGRYVAFRTYASNLVAGDTNNCEDIFVHDRISHTTERVSVLNDGSEGNGRSWEPSISADGRYVAFGSELILGSDDTNNCQDIFVHDRINHTTERVSVSSNGTEANGESFAPSISADGQCVAFESDAYNLVAGDTTLGRDILVRVRK
ncbi:MAG TPA: Ig-like domain-containing protein, partial [Anaerolineae bacterium]|nr:Ig-like domain-containing protein [Anaerolineae bacterium]